MQLSGVQYPLNMLNICLNVLTITVAQWSWEVLPVFHHNHSLPFTLTLSQLERGDRRHAPASSLRCRGEGRGERECERFTFCLAARKVISCLASSGGNNSESLTPLDPLLFWIPMLSLCANVGEISAP